MEHNVTVTKLTTNNMNIKQHRKNKIIILALTAILIFGFGFSNKVKAEGPSIYISPTNLSKTVGNIFDISVKVNPSGQKVCVVEGKLALNKLSCQKITMGSAISAQTSPSCDDLSFLLGIQGCTTSDKTIFTVTVKAESAGSGTAIFTGIDIIGEGVSISSTSLGGSYTITSPCTCGAWSAWQSGACGGGSCSSTQRLQTRTRLCTPSGCEAKDEYRCIEDSGCIPRLPAMETEEGEVEREGVIEQPTEEKVEEPQKEETGIPEEITFPEEKIPQKSLLANLAVALKGITKSVLLTIVISLCLVGLVAIGAREWWLFQKKRKK